MITNLLADQQTLEVFGRMLTEAEKDESVQEHMAALTIRKQSEEIHAVSGSK